MRIGSQYDRRVIVFAPTGRDAALTCQLLAKANVHCVACGSMEEVCTRAANEGAAVLLLAEETLHPSAFNHLSAFLSRQESWSDIPILVFTGNRATIHPRQSTSRLLAKLGNLTFLDRPVRPITMLSAVRSALRARHRQYRSREELVQRQLAVQQRDKFLAMLGHELRNPLGAILMAVQLMEQNASETARYRGIVSRQASHLARLVDDLLDVSRVTSGKIVLQRAPVNIVDLVERSLQSQQGALAAQRLNVSYEAHDRRVFVQGDADRLEQVFTNLITNAIKYTEAGGSIHVSVEASNGVASISVRDSGVGIAADVLPRVFELFVQADNTLDRAKGGMGIGLTLVKTLTELHGGTVAAASEGLGQGSIFTVRLPLCDVVADSDAPDAQSQPKSTARCNVLIIEDNEDSRKALKELLQSFGHRVDSIGDGWEGIARALDRKPDVLVVDIGLPGIDGYGVARSVRKALGSSVYLIALTGYGQPEDRELAQRAGFDVHFTKPVDSEVIKRALDRFVAAKLCS